MICTVSLDEGQGLLLMVQAKVLSPMESAVTVVFPKFTFPNRPVPLTTVQVPVPLDGILPWS